MGIGIEVLCTCGRLWSGRRSLGVLCVVVVAIAVVAPAGVAQPMPVPSPRLSMASEARAFPAYPRTCPVVHRPSFYTWSPNCLVDEQTLVTIGGVQGSSYTDVRSSVGLTVTPDVVRYGQHFTVSVITSLPECKVANVPSVPSGCFNKDTGFSGLYLRLLPVTNPEYVYPQYYPSVHQAGNCYSPTKCTFWFTRPAGGTEDALTSHWIVPLMQMTINLGIPQGDPGANQDPARLETARVETAMRLCPPTVSCPSEVSGRVTQLGSGAQGVGGVTVRADCRGGGTTTTAPNGNYSFILNRGECPVSVTPPAGEEATPNQRVVHVGPRNISGVDFQVGCAHGHGAHAAAAGATSCLDVQVKTLGPSRSGLAIYRHFSTEDRSKAFFLPPYTRQCASGCTNVLVTVTDPLTHQPVSDATVTASTTEIHAVAGHGFLCDQAEPTDCGTRLVNLPTDLDGQVHLLYWAPGLITPESPTITVTAQERSHEGSGETSFTVRPDLIYQKDDGTLTRKEVEELAFWVAGKTLVARLGTLIGGLSGLETSLGVSINFLIGLEQASEHAVELLERVEAVTPIIGVLEVAHLGGELWERQGFIAELLDALGVNAIGLGDDPSEASVPAPPSAVLDSRLANYGTVAPFHAGANGLLWTYAKHLLFLYEHNDVAFGAQFLHVKIYEVSYCVEGELCGPGYRSYLAGIQPELYIEFSSNRNRRAQSFAPHDFTIPYDPNAWTEVQPNLKGLSG